MSTIASLVAAGGTLQKGPQKLQSVFTLQQALVRLGDMTASPDGVFGPLTEGGVRAAQLHAKLPQTGVVDVATATAIDIRSASADKVLLLVGEPPWRIIGLKETGVREQGNNAGPDIKRYIAGAHCGSIGDPWCAIFMNYCLETAGIPGTRSPAARSFEHHPNFVKIAGPALGAIATFWRGIKSQGKGHVGTYDGEQGNLIAVHGGNEGDRVQTEQFSRSKPGWGLVAYYWPKHDMQGNAIPLPVIGAIKPRHLSGSSSGKVT